MLATLQAATGLIFGVFVALHLLNTWLAAFGAETYDGVQRALRAAYQLPPLEALILCALLVHLGIGLYRVWQSPRPTVARGRWHRYAGLFLAVFIGGHILAVRGSSWIFDVYPGFEGLAFTLQAVPGYFYPYYFLLALAGLYHGLNGAGIALARLRGGAVLALPTLKRATAVGAAATVAALGGLGGIWTHLDNPQDSAFARLALAVLAGDVL
ncbi:MAG: hypothetical protein AAGG11_16155 [Pseudomonadota bacterium]